MSAETLRRAAALMRARAEAIEIPWHPYSDPAFPERSTPDEYMQDMQGYLGGEWGDQAGSWHPAAALAVADLLDATAGHVEYTGDETSEDVRHSLAVARAFLQEAAS